MVIGSVGGGYELLNVTNVAGNTWTIVRGQQGTVAGAALAGSSVVAAVVPASPSWTQIVPGDGLTSPTVIGYLDFGISPIPPHLPIIQDCSVYGLASPGDFAVGITPDNWVQVPQQSNFWSNGNMLNLVSANLPGFLPASDQTGVVAGATAANLPADRCFGIRMRIRQAGTTTQHDGGTCDIVAIDNTLYNNINHHPEWGGSIGMGQYGVCMVDIPQLYVNVSTTLAAAISATDTTITVASSAGFPTSGSFNVEIGTEIMTVTNVSGSTWTVVRGQKGTTAAAALNGAEVVPGVLQRHHRRPHRQLYRLSPQPRGGRPDDERSGRAGRLPVHAGADDAAGDRRLVRQRRALRLDGRRPRAVRLCRATVGERPADDR